MQITMKEDARGSLDGRHVNSYVKGETYTVTDSLGAVFIKDGVAIEAKRGTKAVAPSENK